VFLTEVGVLVVGVVLSFAVAAYFESGWTFGFGLVLTVVEFIAFRRRTRPWKIGYDAECFELSRAERSLHPRRARFKRIIGRTLLWVPSVIAALVLFFFPIVTHLAHPSSRYLTHYRVPIPWTISVFGRYGWVDAFVSGGKGRFGMTQFWDREALFSRMTFRAISPDADTFEFNHEMAAVERGGATQAHSREFRLGDVILTCWQFVPRRPRVHSLGLVRISPFWEVTCETPVTEHRRNLYASFWGSEADMPAFYKIIEGVTPVE
jgi:hypothetical protein